MQRAMISTFRLMALAAMVILTATTIPLVADANDRSAAPVSCPPSC